MKKVFQAVVLLWAILGFSCSVQTGTSLESSATLRGEAGLLSSSVRWTSQIDPSVLTEKIPGVRGAEPYVQSDTVTLNAALETQAAVYPSLPDFYELDLSAMDSEARETLESFCAAVISGERAESFMQANKAYALAIFRYDLRMELGKNFLLASYVAGRPGFTKDVYECPVRFFVKDGSYFDAVVHVHKGEDGWKVSQIAFRNLYGE